ncbi:MAG TPA: oligosaccharide flippase family protein, partial [Methanoregula sp.]|nr:oligosaccharide flippase family protein [Methanoregula sp.]
MSELEHEVQRHSIMYLISSAGITLLGFLATIFYAHWVGADVLGQYMVFVSCLSILSIFCDLGIGYATTYRICEGKDPDIYFSAGLILRLGLLAIVSVVLVLFGKILIGDLRNNQLFWVLILVLGISTLTSAISTSLGASNRLGLAASVSLIDNTTRILVQALAVFLGFQVYGLIGGMIAGLLVELVIDLRYLDYRLVRFDWAHAHKIFSFSSWAFMSSTCTVLFDNANLLIISYFLTIADAGIFGVCWTFSFFALFVSTALVNTLFVKVSRWKAVGDWNAITVSLSRAMSYALILAVP